MSRHILRAVYHYVTHIYLNEGEPPSVVQIADAVRLTEYQVQDALETLRLQGRLYRRIPVAALDQRRAS